MMGYKENFQLGDLILPNNIFYAPMAGYTDMPMRKIAMKYKPGLIYCEMVKVEALIRDREKTYKLLDFSEDMHPIGAQLCGSNSKVFPEASKIIEDLGFDVVDLNCGCPVPKVVKDGSGSAMLKTPLLIGEIVSSMKNSVNIPITVKIRIGWDDATINALEVVKIVKEAGADAIIIHGRTRKQGYSGKSNRDYIKQCKEVAKDIPVIANGDLFEVSDVFDIFEQTNCDGVLLARGMLSKPYFVEDIKNAYLEKPDLKRDPLFIKKVVLQHINYILEYQNEKKALLDIRRIGAWYLKGQREIKKLRIAVNHANTAKEAIEFIENFAWENNGE